MFFTVVRLLSRPDVRRISALLFGEKRGIVTAGRPDRRVTRTEKEEAEMQSRIQDPDRFRFPVISTRDNEVTVRSPQLSAPVRILLIGDYHSSLNDERGVPYEQYSARMAQYGNGDMKKLAEYFRQAAEQKYDLILLLGDILSFPSEAGVECLAELIRTSPIPALFTAGNHDWHYEGLPGSDIELRREWIAKRLLPLYGGNDPLQYVYEVNGLKVIMIDNSVYEILPGQLEFVRRELADGKPALLGCHIPLYLPLPGRTVTGYGCGHPDWGAATDPYWEIERRERWPEQGLSRETFDFCREIMMAENLLGIAAGHTHRFCLDCFGNKFQAVVSSKQSWTLDLAGQGQ